MTENSLQKRQLWVSLQAVKRHKNVKLPPEARSYLNKQTYCYQQSYASQLRRQPSLCIGNQFKMQQGCTTGSTVFGLGVRLGVRLSVRARVRIRVRGKHQGQGQGQRQSKGHQHQALWLTVWVRVTVRVGIRFRVRAKCQGQVLGHGVRGCRCLRVELGLGFRFSATGQGRDQGKVIVTDLVRLGLKYSIKGQHQALVLGLVFFQGLFLNL